MDHRGTMFEVTIVLLAARWPLVLSSNNVLNTTATTSHVHFALRW